LTTISSHPSLELAPGGDHATKARSKGETGSGSSTLGASLANPHGALPPLPSHVAAELRAALVTYTSDPSEQQGIS